MSLTFSARNLAAATLMASAVILGACANEPPPAPRSDIGFVGRPIKLDVASISVDDRYNPPGRAPNVEQLHSVTPAGIAQRWADTRLVAVGKRGIATLTILDGSVVETRLPTKGGVEGFFGDQVDTKLTGSLKAKLNVAIQGDKPGDYAAYSATVSASGTQTILQSATLNERDKAYSDLMQVVAQKFDAALTAEVNRNMAAVIRP
ncbi:hypothetical protein [Parvibaculum sp.]|uniref:hypothetical protein n=1 Tax=Parvibaculum sp. TaxID=2024848 RepID=UPI00320F83D1